MSENELNTHTRTKPQWGCALTVTNYPSWYSSIPGCWWMFAVMYRCLCAL